MPDATVWEDIKRAYESSPETKLEIADRYGISLYDIDKRIRTGEFPKRVSGAAGLKFIAARRAIREATASGAIPQDLPSEAPPAIARPPDTTASAAAPPAAPQALNQPSPRATKSTTTAANTGGTQPHRRAIIARLYRVIDARLVEIEQRFMQLQRPTAAEAEREGRDLATLIKNFEKLMELSADLARPADAAGLGRPARMPGTDAALAAQTLSDEAERFRRELADRLDRLRTNGAVGGAVR